MQHAAPFPRSPLLDAKAIRTLARSMYRRMQSDGYGHDQMINFASAVIDLVRAELDDVAGETH